MNNLTLVAAVIITLGDYKMIAPFHKVTKTNPKVNSNEKRLMFIYCVNMSDT